MLQKKSLFSGVTLLFLMLPFGNQMLADTPVRVASVPLALDNAVLSVGNESLDSTTSGRVPNYLKVIAGTMPEAAPSFAHLFKTVLYGGTISPEIKAAMGLKIAQETGSPYLVAHLTRILKTTEKGRTLIALSTKAEPKDDAERLALRYATSLTKAVHGMGDTEFALVRAYYNDAQIVELSSVTCFFNYFARFCQGAGLPLEAWVKEAPDALPKEETREDKAARITLASDAEMETGAKLLTPSPDLKKGLGIGIANSQRAMMRVPDIGEAWWGYMRTSRAGAKLSRTMQLHISFAVSMANGCRYCTVHQVVGLKRQGVEISKLLAMAKDDSALSPKELIVVTFARKLTKNPGEVTSADYETLRKGLGDDREAYDALLQTCTFSFMNRFTDGLRLPSEDEAVKVYQEVYGDGSYRAYSSEKTKR